MSSTLMRLFSTSSESVVATISVTSAISPCRFASANDRSWNTGPKTASLSIDQSGRSRFRASARRAGFQITGVAVMYRRRAAGIRSLSWMMRNVEGVSAAVPAVWWASSPISRSKLRGKICRASAIRPDEWYVESTTAVCFFSSACCRNVAMSAGLVVTGVPMSARLRSSSSGLRRPTVSSPQTTRKTGLRIVWSAHASSVCFSSARLGTKIPIRAGSGRCSSA